MNKNRLLILFILRLVIFGLFIMSGVLKLYPSIVPFEKQLVDLGFVDWCSAPYMARLIIGLELALGIAFLQSNHLKKLVIPATAALLVAFCVHLSIVIYTQGANSGNCGCFGQLIPMTPLQALIKNILTLGLLGYMYLIYKEREKGKNNILILVIIYLASNLAVFMFYPFSPCNTAKIDESDIVVTLPKDTVVVTNVLNKDSLKADSIAKLNTIKKVDPIKNPLVDTAKKIIPPVIVGDQLCLVKKVSGYAPFKKFSDGSFADLDDGRKIVTLFNVECEHCMETAKKLGELSKKRKMPPVYILFWGEESQVENFFKVAQYRFPYKVIDPSTFFQLLGSAPSPPKVTFLCNGNVISEFDNSSFSIEKLDAVLNK